MNSQFRFFRRFPWHVATRRAYGSDLFIVIGSSLVVYPAALMPQYAFEAGAKLVIVNLSETPMDHLATVRITGKAGEARAAIIARLKKGE